MKIAWIILIISALTDFVINTGTSLASAMVATGNASMPNKAVIFLAVLGGAVAMCRTVQQALKSAIGNHDNLLGGQDPPKQ